jgi:hypothetical protein
MSDNGLRLLVAEYRLLYRALKHFEGHLESLSVSADDEDEQLEHDEDLQTLEGLIRSVVIAAKTDYSVEID